MAIPTQYAGIQFRSRLEAKWASFFTHLGWEWTYEPFDGNYYIPDFLIHGDSPLIVEVKPASTLEHYQNTIEKVQAGLVGHWSGRILIVGVSPLPNLKMEYPPSHPIGLMSEVTEDCGIATCTHLEADISYCQRNRWWAAGLWNSANQLGELCHEFGGYTCSPSGIRDGGNSGLFDHSKRIETLWAAASNDVQWRAK